MSKPILAVCGDSYFAPAVAVPGTHFSELIAKHYNYELFPISRGGSSNGGIRLQISTAIQENADFILVGDTWTDRIEFANTESTNKYLREDYAYNIRYDHHTDDISTVQLADKFRNAIYSESIRNMLPEKKNIPYAKTQIPTKIKKAVTEYIMHLHDSQFLYQKSAWIIANGIYELERSEIPYLFVLGDSRWTNYPEVIHWTSKTSRVTSRLSPYKYRHGNEPYHTSKRTQQQIASDMIDYIQKHNLLKKN